MLMRNRRLDLISYCLVIIYLFFSGCGSENQQDKSETQQNKLRQEARNLYKEKKFSEALQLLEQAVDIDRQTMPPDHEELLEQINSLAWNYRKHDLDKTIVYQKEHLALAKKYFGESHIVDNGRVAKHSMVAQSLQMLGSWYLSKGDAEKAYETYNEHLEVNRRVFGEESEGVIGAYKHLIRIYEKRKDFAKALEYMERILNIAIKLGNSHHVKSYRKDVAEIKKKMEEHNNLL